jgi:hypothetical protein
VLLVVIIAALVIGSGAASAAVSALVTIVLIVTGCVVAVAVLGSAAWLIWRARLRAASAGNVNTASAGNVTAASASNATASDRPGRPIGAPAVYQLPPESRPQLEESHKPAAIGPGREVHYHFHVSAAELAAIMQNHAERETP